MTYFRSRKLLDACRDITCTWPLPHACDFTSEAAHSNQLRDGKGKGLKAPDYAVAAICHTAHMECDRGATLTKQERREAWDEAHRKTLHELIMMGVLAVPRGKIERPVVSGPICRACEGTMYDEEDSI